MNPRAADYLRQQRELGFRTVYTAGAPDPPSPPGPHAPGPADALPALEKKHAACARCGLSRTRKKFVFGQGAPDARLMFVGEAPGADEDAQGLPLVGRAGHLLTRMIENGMGLKRSEVYIANILKCRPPGNRDPLPAEREACAPILREQIRVIRPAFICCLGRIAGRFLLGLEDTVALKDMRGRFYDHAGARVCVTYHPSALLQHPEWKAPAWEDLKRLMKAMGLALPAGNK
jgi:DNA polymerase